jgi:transcriptional regulator with XRE-family HTH domain
MPRAYSAFNTLLGARVRGAREAAGIDQRDFAKRLKIDRTVVSRIESGKIPLSAERLVQIAGLVNEPITALLPTTSRRGRRAA